METNNNSSQSGDSSSSQPSDGSSSEGTSPAGSSSGNASSSHSYGAISGNHPATDDGRSGVSGPTHRNSRSTPESTPSREALLSAIIDNSSDAIISKDLSGIITSWNGGAEAMFGYSAQEAVGQPITMLIPHERLNEEDKILQRLRRGEKLKDFETVRQRKDGKRLHVSLTISPVLDEGGDIVGASKIVRDITRRKQAEKKLKEINNNLEERVKERTQSLIDYQKQLRSLAARLSEAEEQERHQLATELHDNLGQMLAVTKMKVDMLAKSGITGEEASEIDDIQQGLQEALTYTRDLMSDLKPPPTLDKENVTESIEWLAEKMKKHDLEVVVEDDGKLKKASREIRKTLLQCVRELLFNVIKHTDEDTAWIRMRTLNDQVEIKVEDNGPGMEDTGVDAPSKDGGFGLFNIKERLALLDCQTEIESEQDAGTTIRILAPLKDAENKTVSSNRSSKYPDRTENTMKRPAKVMLVDDHQMVRQGLKEILNKEDDIAVVAEASGGHEALDLVKEAEPDIVLMDLIMPDMDGIEVTRRLKEQLPNVRIAGLSIQEDEEMVARLFEAGATAFLSKQEAYETLCETIRGETRHLREE